MPIISIVDVMINLLPQTIIIDHSDTLTPPPEDDVCMQSDHVSRDANQEEWFMENTKTQPASNSPASSKISSTSTPLQRSSRTQIPKMIFLETVAKQDTTCSQIKCHVMQIKKNGLWKIQRHSQRLTHLQVQRQHPPQLHCKDQVEQKYPQ